MLKNGRPYHLPQISMPYDIVLNKLDEEGIKYELISLNPSEDDGIKISQPFVYSDEMEKCNVDDTNPIWLSNDGENVNICDGHHRYIKSLIDNNLLKAVKIDLNEKDACRVLNKIQDIYEYEQARNMEEVEDQDAINYYDNNAESGKDNTNTEFLDSLEEDNLALQAEASSKNEKTIVAYRKEPIKENSIIGNFFILKPIDGYDKYEIAFDNLLDVNALGVVYKDGQEPVDILAKNWFPHINFEKLSEQYNIPALNLKNKAIAEKAMKNGYDGIKYNDTLIQGLK
jgi:hypothetical protein